MVHNRIERKGEEWSGVEHVTLLFGCFKSLGKEKTGNENYSLLDLWRVKIMRAMNGKGGTHCPFLAIPLPPIKLLPNMGYLSLAIPPLATPSIATLPNIPLRIRTQKTGGNEGSSVAVDAVC